MSLSTRRLLPCRWSSHLSLATALNVAGLVLNALGVILLFFFAIPYRTRTEGKSPRTVVIPGVYEKAIRQEARYDRFALSGLAAVLVGTSLQILVALVI